MKLCFRRFIVLLLFSLLAACGGGSNSDPATPPDTQNPGTPATSQNAKWTYMVYLGADNNLSYSGLMDLIEMEKVGSKNGVNIVVQAEFSTTYTNFGQIGHADYQGETLRFKVNSDNDPEDVNLPLAASVGRVDMAKPEALTDFIVWAKNNHPADHYALVIWDHGAGWKVTGATRGAVQDESSGNFMSLIDLANGVRNAGVHFDLIDFDACLMAMYEVAYQFRGLTDYLVFSEETEPGDGNPYDTILADLAANPSMSARQLAIATVDRYQQYYASSSARSENTTKSAIAMDQLDLLHQRVTALANAMVSEFGSVEAAVVNAAQNSQVFAYLENHDLYDFCRKLSSNLNTQRTKAAADAILGLFDTGNLIVANKRTGTGVDNAHGLAIYLPTRNQVSTDTTVNVLQNYRSLSSNNNVAPPASPWFDAVTAFIGTSDDQQLETGGFAFYIFWDTDADVDLYVWEPGQDDIYAPWMGQATPNGFFSGDSTETGLSEEYYVANNYVQTGTYDILINYFDDGPTTSWANIYFSYFDPRVDSEWQTYGPIPLSLTPPLANLDTIDLLEELNSYNDWWYPYQISRTGPGSTSSLQLGTKTLNLRIARKKTVPQFNLLRSR
jgi:hypothetical protein